MIKLPKHFHTFEGSLWYMGDVVRKNYAKHHRVIENISDLKATLRAGQWTCLGGYPLYFITSDGAVLSFESVREEFYQCCYSIKHGLNDGWRVVGCEINYEEADLICDHSSKPIQCAYHE